MRDWILNWDNIPYVSLATQLPRNGFSLCVPDLRHFDIVGGAARTNTGTLREVSTTCRASFREKPNISARARASFGGQSSRREDTILLSYAYMLTSFSFGLKRPECGTKWE